jgi:hypothetical protein
MNFELERNIMIDLGLEYCELLEEGHLHEHAKEIMQERVRSGYDGDIWEMVDSEDNEEEFEFDDFMYEIMLEVENLGSTYYQNMQDEKRE